MKKIILFFACLFLFFGTSAQSYMTAGGIRLGTDWGLTVQQRLLKKWTFEGIFQSSLAREETVLTGLAEKHKPLIFKNLNFDAGGGLHKGWSKKNGEVSTKSPFGLTFIAGAEMTLGSLNFSFDFKPALNLSGGEKRFYTQTAVSIRYVLLKNKVFKDLSKKHRKKKRKKKKVARNKN